MIPHHRTRWMPEASAACAVGCVAALHSPLLSLDVSLFLFGATISTLYIFWRGEWSGAFVVRSLVAGYFFRCVVLYLTGKDAIRAIAFSDAAIGLFAVGVIHLARRTTDARAPQDEFVSSTDAVAEREPSSASCCDGAVAEGGSAETAKTAEREEPLRTPLQFGVKVLLAGTLLCAELLAVGVSAAPRVAFAALGLGLLWFLMAGCARLFSGGSGEDRQTEPEGDADTCQACCQWRSAVAEDPETLVSPFRFVATMEERDLKLLVCTTRLKRLDLASSLSGGEQLRYLAGLKELQSLSLCCHDCVQDSHLQYIEGMTQLRELDLSHCRLTDAGLEHIKGMILLQILDLKGQPITDAGLECLRGMSDLRQLDVGYTGITDAGLACLAQLSQLQKLAIREAAVTDRGLEQIKGLTQLQGLDLWATKITDAGLRHLAAMEQLQALDISYTPVTDAGLQHLRVLARLEKLRLVRSGITPAGVRELAFALPKCKILAGD